MIGSVLREDLGPDSDLDVPIRFKPERTRGIVGVAEMQRELADLLACNVDPVRRTAIEEGRNDIRRKAILESARGVYVA